MSQYIKKSQDALVFFILVHFDMLAHWLQVSHYLYRFFIDALNERYMHVYTFECTSRLCWASFRIWHTAQHLALDQRACFHPFSPAVVTTKILNCMLVQLLRLFDSLRVSLHPCTLSCYSLWTDVARNIFKHLPCLWKSILMLAKFW